MLTGLTLTESDRRPRQVAPDAHLYLIEIRSPVFRFAASGEVAGWRDLRLVGSAPPEEYKARKAFQINTVLEQKEGWRSPC